MIDKELTIKLYQTISDSNEIREFNSWHASSIGECPRTQYFRRLGVAQLPQNKASAALVLRWSAGHSIESVIRPHLLKLFPNLKSNERFVSEKLDLTGEYDNRSGNMLIEIKSVNDRAFVQKDNETYLKDEDGTKMWSGKEVKNFVPKMTPYLHHELQNHAYVELLKEHGVEINMITYIYISLSGRIVTYTTKVQEAMTNNVLKRLEVLNEAWRTKTPPDCICGVKNHPLYGPVMQYCPYKEDTTCCSLELIKEKK